MLSHTAILLTDVIPTPLLQPAPAVSVPGNDLLELVTDGYLLLDREFRVTYASHKAELWLHSELLALLGEPYWKFLPKHLAHQLAIGDRDVIESPVMSEARWMHATFETCLKLRLAAYHENWVLSFHEENTELIPALQSLFNLPSAACQTAPPVLTGSTSTSSAKGKVDDSLVTKNASVESAQVALSSQNISNDLRLLIFAAEENERSHIARELHDVLGQYVTAIRFGLENLSSELAACREDLTSLMKTRSLVEQLDQEFHHIALKLRPPMAGSGLKTAVVQYALEWAERSGVHVDLHSPELKCKLSAETETNLYRILQEALNNIYKYAKARRVSVILEVRNQQLQLVIEDNGIGFDLEAYQHNQSHMRKIGLVSMRERAELIGGHCEVESVEGQGTTVIVRVPFNN